MVKFDWFDWAVYDLTFTACVLGTHACAAARDKRFAALAPIAFAMLQRLTLVYLACSLDWEPSCGRWYAIQTAQLLTREYWFAFGQFLVAAILILAASRIARHDHASARNNRVEGAFEHLVRFAESLTCRAARRLNQRMPLQRKHCAQIDRKRKFDLAIDAA